MRDSPQTQLLQERQPRVRRPDHDDPGVDADLRLQGQLPADEAEGERSLKAPEGRDKYYSEYI